MDILIEEAPQLIISFLLILAATVLLALRIATTLEGMPLLILVAGYWIGNGASRLTAAKVEQTLTPPQADQLVHLLTQATQPIAQVNPALMPIPSAPPSNQPQPIILPSTKSGGSS